MHSEYTAEPRADAAKSVTLEKVAGADSSPSIGTRFTYTYKSVPADKLNQRVRVALEREYPGTDRLHWRAVD